MKAGAAALFLNEGRRRFGCQVNLHWVQTVESKPSCPAIVQFSRVSAFFFFFPSKTCKRLFIVQHVVWLKQLKPSAGTKVELVYFLVPLPSSMALNKAERKRAANRDELTGDVRDPLLTYSLMDSAVWLSLGRCAAAAVPLASACGTNRATAMLIASWATRVASSSSPAARGRTIQPTLISGENRCPEPHLCLGKVPTSAFPVPFPHFFHKLRSHDILELWNVEIWQKKQAIYLKALDQEWTNYLAEGPQWLLKIYGCDEPELNANIQTSKEKKSIAVP